MPISDPFREHGDYLAWGRAHRFAQNVARPAFADQLPQLLAARGNRSLLASGCRRSYGDSGLNAEQALVDMRSLDRVIAFDPASGVLEAEAGLTLGAILDLVAAARNGAGRWFLPVTPGTKFVTLGGAIANDVHGKNHHTAGCFGNHVLSLTLLRSDGRRLTCSPAENADLFAATIGGLGLTGVIVSARIALKAVPGPAMEHEDIRYDHLDAFYNLAEESLADWEYTVAWIDCLASGRQAGRGVFSRSRHISGGRPMGGLAPRIAIPFSLPNFVLNTLSLKALNAVYWRRADARPRPRTVSQDKVFYPLDAIGRWNLMYGRRGFFQYQCVVPKAVEKSAIRDLLAEISRAGQGSFLAVLKTMGDRPSPGMLSFPMAGTTLALDFPNTGPRTLALLDRLDRITGAAGGRIYPAKDGRVSAADFQRGYPIWGAFSTQVDPVFSSSFWRRVSAPINSQSKDPI